MARTAEPYRHDPLCPIGSHPDWTECVHCDLIAAVRSDERKQLGTVNLPAENHRGYEQGRADTIRKEDRGE